MNSSTTKTPSSTAMTPASTGETKSSAPSPTTPTSGTTKSVVAKVSVKSPQTKMSFKTSTAPVALPSQAVVRSAPSLRSSSMRRKWQWIPVQIETSQETWIFLHPIDKSHQVCVQASPSMKMPSLLVQSELISSKYKEQHGISYKHLLQH